MQGLLFDPVSIYERLTSSAISRRSNGVLSGQLSIFADGGSPERRTGAVALLSDGGEM
jgi:hypothetical protein